MKSRYATRFFTLTRSFIGVACVVLCLVRPAHAAWTLYATGVGTGPGAQLSALYAINPLTGAASLVCQLTNLHVYGGGLAYDAATDTMFATGTDFASVQTVFSIDRFTGATTVVGHPNPNGPAGGNYSSGGLAINPLTGIMYSTVINGGPNYGLCTISKTTGAATLIGQFTGPFTGLYGLGFRDDGVLFGNGFADPSQISVLFTVNTATATSTVVGPHGVTVGGKLEYSGLAFGTNGTLYSLGSTSASAQGLYSVNPATGAATLIGDTIITFGVDGGLAFAPDQLVPQPVALNITITITNTLLLSWPTNSANSFPYVLHENTNFNPSAWLAITNVPDYSSGTNRVVLPFPSTTRFYRLKTL